MVQTAELQNSKEMLLKKFLLVLSCPTFVFLRLRKLKQFSRNLRQSTIFLRYLMSFSSPCQIAEVVHGGAGAVVGLGHPRVLALVGHDEL